MKTLYPIQKKNNGIIVIEDKTYQDFTSNDVLGLSQDSELIQKTKLFLQEYGMGSGGSRLLGGDRTLCHLLESEMANFKGMNSGLLFNSGYHANTGLFSVFYGPQDVVFADRLVHASLIDGIRLSSAKLFRYQDITHLSLLLNDHRFKYRHAVLVTESIFSMDGTRSDLKALCDLKKKFQTELWVDEAHATGVYGDLGSGLTEAYLSDIDLVIGTFGKAFGGYGAYVTCTHHKSALINHCRAFIFSTALPLPVVYWNKEALHKIKTMSLQRKKLALISATFRKKAYEKGLQVCGDTHIVPWVIGDEEKAVHYANFFKENGLWVQAIVHPTVPKKKARIRFSFSVFHTEKDLEKVLAVIDKLLNR